jgi:hypothetical protein
VRTGASAILVLMGRHSTHDRTGSAAVGLVGATGTGRIGRSGWKPNPEDDRFGLDRLVIVD